MHWARLEASALGSLNAACPAWKKEEERSVRVSQNSDFAADDVMNEAVDEPVSRTEG